MAKRQVVLLGMALALATGGRAQQQIQQEGVLGELFSGDASVRGAVLLRAQATQVLSGSQIAAGEGVALLKLTRGGQVRICPRTKLSLNADTTGRALSLGLDAGAMELQYQLASGVDSLLTPDFRLQLISPGLFHLAISVSASGDTCLQSLRGADAAVFVAEMMGDESYQLSPGKKVLFRNGKIADSTDAPENCGCPETAPPKPLVVQSAPPSAPAPEKAPQLEPDAGIAQQIAALSPPQPLEPERSHESTALAEASAPAVPGDAGEAAPAHLEAESQFEYHGEQAQQDFYTAVARLSVATDNSKMALATVPQLPPWTEQSTPKAQPAAVVAPAPGGPGFLHRFFRRLFGRG